MPNNQNVGTCDYEIIKEGDADVLKINCNNCPYSPSLEDSPICMSRTIDKLIQVPSAGRIIFSCRRNYEYDYKQSQMLMQIANTYNYLIKQKKILSLSLIPLSEYTQYWGFTIQYLILNLLKTDPIGCYVEIIRYIREEKIKIKKTDSLEEVSLRAEYLQILNTLKSLLEQTQIISLIKSYVAGYSIGSRDLYRNIFKPSIRPDFMFTRIMAEQPLDGEELDAYSLDNNTDITIFKIPGEVTYLYHLNPPEFKISEDMYEILDIARNALAEHKPKKDEFIDPEKMRQTFVNIGKDMIQEIAEHKGIDLSFEQVHELAQILVRYTVGFGLIEVLLKDPKIQDISVNSPIGETPIFIIHQDFHECVTNIIPSKEDGESWASKFRMLSGRPLDEANPILDTELLLPYSRARVAVITRPLNPIGLAYSFRRHRDNPWTFPLFIKNKMMNPLAAGLLSFIIQGGRSLIFAGTRSSGKTSLMGAMMLEIMRKYRMITIEDTQELGINVMRKLGYNIQPMKVRSALTKGGSELQADEGIRTSLRLGDSSLIIGEIRSSEASAMYEAMRIGALANVVAGTIHGGDPYSVYDRVVNDLKVPKTSFKATDIIIISNPVKSADGLHSSRRILQITEVRKHWEEDPLREKGFVDLMKYNPKTDQLEPTDELINGDSEILKIIAGNVKEWAGNWNAVWDNILLRAKIKEALVNYSDKIKDPSILESDFIVKSNDQFHSISDNIMEEVGYIDTKKVFKKWETWLKDIIKNNQHQSKII